MIANRRTLTYVAIALIVGAALALAVALARSDAPASSSASAAAQTQAQGGVLGDTSGAGTIASADPAKQEPLLDKFTAKDPFIPFAVASPTPTTTESTAAAVPALGARQGQRDDLHGRAGRHRSRAAPQPSRSRASHRAT